MEPEQVAGLLVGQVANLAGVTVKTVRHYEKLGLIEASTREQNGYKRYAAETVVRVACIAALGRARVPLSRVTEILDRAPSAAETIQTVVDVVRTERERIDEQLELLESFGRAVNAGEGPLEELGRPFVGAVEAALGGTGESVREDTWRMERRVAGLLASFGIAAGELPDAARGYIRDHAGAVAAALEADAAFARLRDAAVDDPAVDDVAARLRQARATVVALRDLLERPAEEATAALGAVIRPKLSDAQLAALRRSAGAA